MKHAGSLTLKVLGAAGGYPYAGHACSGYLVAAGDCRILCDCGPGVAARLLSELEACDLDAVFITHLHPDHMLDLVALGYALMTEWVAKRRHHRVILWVPSGGEEFLANLVGLFGHRHWRLDDSDFGPGYAAIRDTARSGRDWFFTVFDCREFTPGSNWSFGGVDISTFLADHSVPNAAIRIEYGGRTLVYTGDTRWMPTLAGFVAGADLLIAEAHFSASHPPGGAHLTPRETGTLARLAGARKLLVCHLASPDDGPRALAEIRSEFTGDVMLAIETDGLTI